MGLLRNSFRSEMIPGFNLARRRRKRTAGLAVAKLRTFFLQQRIQVKPGAIAAEEIFRNKPTETIGGCHSQ